MLMKVPVLRSSVCTLQRARDKSHVRAAGTNFDHATTAGGG